MLAERLQIPFVSTGKIFRRLLKERDPDGLEAAEYWEDGKLVPDEIVRRVLTRHLGQQDIAKGFVMDGFPRDLSQYSWADEVFPESVSVVVCLQLDEATIWRRLRKRREIEHRLDETDEAIQARLADYYEKTFPVIERFQDDGTPVIKVDAAPAIEVIHQDIWAKIQPFIRLKSNE